MTPLAKNYVTERLDLASVFIYKILVAQHAIPRAGYDSIYLWTLWIQVEH